MRFIVTGEWNRNRLLQVIVLLYSVYVALLWVTNLLLYFQKMTLAPSSVVAYYLGNPEQYLSPRSYQGLLEVSHFHLFAVGMLLLVLTHLVLFCPFKTWLKITLVTTPFVAALVDEGAGWLVRFVSPDFAILKVAGFVVLQASLAALVGLSIWAIFGGAQHHYDSGVPPDELDFDDDDDF